jgi:hypothetical protein
MTAMNAWLRALERANTKDELVAQARDFCALLHPRDLAALPEDVRAIRIEGPDDIARLRTRLAACGAVARERAFDAAKLGDLVAYIDQAGARLREISTRAEL